MLLNYIIYICLLILFIYKKGGIFKIEMYFSEEHDSKPPAIYFSTIPFHPNSKIHIHIINNRFIQRCCYI